MAKGGLWGRGTPALTNCSGPAHVTALDPSPPGGVSHGTPLTPHPSTSQMSSDRKALSLTASRHGTVTAPERTFPRLGINAGCQADECQEEAAGEHQGEEHPGGHPLLGRWHAGPHESPPSPAGTTPVCQKNAHGITKSRDRLPREKDAHRGARKKLLLQKNGDQCTLAGSSPPAHSPQKGGRGATLRERCSSRWSAWPLQGGALHFQKPWSGGI